MLSHLIILMPFLSFYQRHFPLLCFTIIAHTRRKTLLFFVLQIVFRMSNTATTQLPNTKAKNHERGY
jgi:hypothetical protein